MVFRRKQPRADSADRHALYQQAVQDTESEIDFVLETWQQLRERPAKLLRVDFCGTAYTACEWVQRDNLQFAVGIDLDEEVLSWGEQHNLSQLNDDELDRIDLRRENVLTSTAPAADIVLAMNFSYYLFLERDLLLEYFSHVHETLVDDGIFMLDAYGGYDAPRDIEEERECDGFTYTWEQRDFNPIDSLMTCHIHFAFPDGSALPSAFSYRWRLWTLPEIRELLSEAGFSHVTVYWEGTDEESGEGDGIYVPADVGDADPGWVCYIVAQR